MAHYHHAVFDQLKQQSIFASSRSAARLWLVALLSLDSLNEAVHRQVLKRRALNVMAVLAGCARADQDISVRL